MLSCALALPTLSIAANPLTSATVGRSPRPRNSSTTIRASAPYALQVDVSLLPTIPRRLIIPTPMASHGQGFGAPLQFPCLRTTEKPFPCAATLSTVKALSVGKIVPTTANLSTHFSCRQKMAAYTLLSRTEIAPASSGCVFVKKILSGKNAVLLSITQPLVRFEVASI